MKARPQRKPTIFVHADRYRPDQWYRRFVEVLNRCGQVDIEVIDLLTLPLSDLKARVQPGDGLLGRFGHRPDDLGRIRPIYASLHELVGGRIFPGPRSYHLYDDKVRQAAMFAARGYPAPATRWIEGPDALRAFLDVAGLTYPVVVKGASGAGSSAVRLARFEAEVPLPCLVQEFCPGNLCDWRIHVIGRRVMGFVRFNRDSDFRASGSGRFFYPKHMPAEIVELATRISQENGFESMGYDFVRHHGQWRLLEMSYVCPDITLADCGAYWDTALSQWVPKPGIYPEDFVVEDFLRQYYGIALPPRPAHRMQVLSRTYGRRLPRILLIADVPDWIFERHARALAERLRDEFDFDLAYRDQTFDEEQYDLVYALEFTLVDTAKIRQPRRFLAGIRSHSSWSQRDPARLAETLRRRFQKIHVVSRRLWDIFAPLVPDLELLSHGVDTDFFRPSRSISSSAGRLRLGWAGNRKTPTKGFNDFIEPLGALAGVELVYCGYSDCNLSQEAMREFYDSIDTYVSSSITEGNNNSLLEAASMERALITTDTGTVPEYLEDGVSALIVPRDLAVLRAAVERLRDDPALRHRLGAAARPAVVARFDWKQQSEAFRRWFRDALGLREEQLAQLEASARQTVDLAPDDPDGLELLAVVLAERRLWVEAAAICRRLLRQSPEYVPMLHLLARCLEQTSDVDAAKLVRERIRALPTPPSFTQSAGQEAAAWEEEVARQTSIVCDATFPGCTLILVDDAQLGRGFAPDRTVIPFLEHHGEYWGPPADDKMAIANLERLRISGAEYFVLAWPAFWWLDCYPDFIEYVRTSYSCRLEGSRLLIFDLRMPGTALALDDRDRTVAP